jgi:low temperature requirement protein LtrA
MTDQPASTDPAGMLRRFKRRFWQPPRAHGDVIEDRTVSFLELFYDLVYVVVIARASHTLAEHISWRGLAEFAVIFGLIWIAWLNGTLYYDLHGREEGRTRTFVFIQMMLLALLAVFTADAAGEGGTAFAIVYALFLVVLTWLWYSVRRQDAAEYMALTKRYLIGMVMITITMATSATLPDDARMLVWATVVVGYLAAAMLLGRSGDGMRFGSTATDSLVERFGLFVIIVLGEVVVGVVSGLSETERTFESVGTGLVGLMIGFAFWWTYFDFVGRRLPRSTHMGLIGWMISHLPVALSITATGAAMISLIEHAGDDRAPAETAWLLAGSVALGLLAMIVTIHSLADYERVLSVYHPLSYALTMAAIASLLVGWARPAPWLLALLLVAILSAVWWFAVDRWLRLDNPDDASPNAGVSARPTGSE